MKHNRHVFWFMTLVALFVLLNTARRVDAQERQTFTKEQQEQARKGAAQAPAPLPLGCRGPVTQVLDLGDENLKFTPAVFGTNPGGGEGGQFDKTPVLTTRVSLAQGTCLDAHLSAIVGSKQSYGVSRMTLFQITLTSLAPVGAPRHMVGHFERPFGSTSPAVALEAERDVDMYASNFFQRVGSGNHEVPPGTYRVDVWWAGGPDPGGAIGAAFILKLYFR